MSSEARTVIATVVVSVLAYAVLVITLDVICNPRTDASRHAAGVVPRK